MDAYERCTNLEKKNLADSVATYGRGSRTFQTTHVIRNVIPKVVRALR